MAEGLQLQLRQEAPIALDCALDCAPGELVALVGPSGSGKTTILRCIAGLHRAASGRITCGAEVWFDAGKAVPPQRRHVGMVFQGYSLLPHLTAEQNVALALWQLPRREQLEHARIWLARVHLHGLEARRPAQLSGGQQQRVALARALARALTRTDDGSPAGVLLLDEPFSAVDQATRRRLQQQLARLRRDLPLPIVLVTHDLDEARMLADRMVLLHRGVSLQAGPPEEIMSRPADARVAHLIGLSNVFAGTVGAGEDLLEWQGRQLRIAAQQRFRPGTRVNWVIAPEGVLLARGDRPSRHADENPVDGVVEDCVALGAFTEVSLRVADADLPIGFSLPTHVARRNSIAAGSQLRINLLAEFIHLMPWSELRA